MVAARPELAARIALKPMAVASFLAIPPFPGRRVDHFTQLDQPPVTAASLGTCLALIREQRVGGAYWARQPALPARFLLIRSAAASAQSALLVEAYGDPLLWLEAPTGSDTAAIIGRCDPWHMLGAASALICDADDELRLIAAILEVPVYVIEPAGGAPRRDCVTAEQQMRDALEIAASVANPFGGPPLNLVEQIALCGFWRELIDSNRDLDGAVGFAFWKQDSVLPLLWGGGDSAGFFNPPASNKPGGAVAIWRSKTAPETLAALEASGTVLVEVEDGFLRSNGLGADCVPPLSITVDRLGAYFDPAQPSALEQLLERGRFDPELVARAARLRETIVAAGLGKYDRGAMALERFDSDKRHILVAGQVEDDRSIIAGGGGMTSNLELLKRVRAAAPEAFIIYKPHPDVVAGHRKGHVDQHISRVFADKVVTHGSISSLIAMVDEVHVNTSLAGFEALMRHKNVTTYGVPFYAGWGLTRDLGPVPSRRTARRSLDELVAATLLLYPRYLDPVSGLPAPAEVVVDRLTDPRLPAPGPLVRLRRLQGRLNRRLTAWRGR